MGVQISVKPPDSGTIVLACTFQDEDGNGVTPDTMLWTLKRVTTGAVVNSRQNQDLSPSSSTENIVLTGADLATFSDDDLSRVVELRGTYTSTLGSGLALNEDVYFSIDED